MTSLITGAEPGFEPIEGYILRERIGSGGYGEVWLADAPGGLQKAIKFVFGTIDERAGNELRSLQRIRAVHHPFILSLERIEVVNNQLIVVTELADGTLLDRLREYHQRGLIGIPRDKVLEYLRDTADALDFLCQKHDLQHLDVKPANLLLVADRVKVADFGLIKDLQHKNMSVMSGLTPTYAAPEMFDGRPGRFSDQYSLAIVYQELLTGCLPFNGRTTAQLATEHLHKAPNLESLPTLERPIIAKALSKKPNQRFNSCRELVDQLFSVQSSPVVSGLGQARSEVAGNQVPSTRSTPRAAKSTPRIEGQPTVTLSGDAVSTLRRQIVELPAIPMPLEPPSDLAPALFIGLGGTGANVLTSLRKRLQDTGLDLQKLDDVAWIQADTDEATLQQSTDVSTPGRLNVDEVIFMPLRPAQAYRQRSQDAYAPLSRRWLYNVPRSLATEGVRPMGMLAYLDHFSDCYQHVHDALKRLADYQLDSNRENKPIRIYLVGSVHGGTGSVLAIEMAFLIRRLLSELDMNGLVQTVLCVGDQSDFASTELATASALACLQEIGHFFRTNGLYPGMPGAPADHASNPPWHRVYLIHGGTLGNQAAWRSAVEQMSDFLCMDACTALGEVLDGPRDEAIDLAKSSHEIDWIPWIRMFASKSLELSAEMRPEILVKRLTLQILRDGLETFTSSVATTIRPSVGRNNSASTSTRATNQSIEFYVSDLFRDQHWTAQAWVRKCMEQLFPLAKNHEPSKASEPETKSKARANTAIGPDLEQLHELGLDQLADALGISFDKSLAIARQMIEQADHGLIAWLRSRWLNNFAGWSELPDVLDCIRQRFVSQSQSLKTVADRFHQQREAMLNNLYAPQSNGQQARIPEAEQRELVEQIRSLNIQASIHQIAGRILSRLGEHVHQIAQIWRNETNMLLGEFRLWIRSIAGELGVRIDAEGRPENLWFPTPASWLGVRETTQKSIDHALMSMLQARLVDLIAPTSTNPLPSNQPTDNANASCNNASANETRRFDSNRLDQLIEFGLDAALQKAVEDGLSFASSDSNSTSKAIDSLNGYANLELDRSHNDLDLNIQALSDQHQSEQLQLLAEGGAKRTLLLLPSGEIHSDSVEQWKKNLGESMTIVELDQLKTAMLCVEGERLDPGMIAHRLWRPTRERYQLAERLHSRTDIEWLPLE